MTHQHTILAAHCLKRSRPPEVPTLQPVALPEPRGGEVRVRMLYAPINPSDINTLEGTYGELRPLPDIPGNEGIGIVEKVGPEVEDVSVGSKVLLQSKTWREAGVWNADEVIPLREVADPQQAAMLRINAATAFTMLKCVHAFCSGEWVVQNAANSGVGRWVIALARRWNIPALHFARRAEAVEELIAEGAGHVLADDDGAVENARRIIGEAPVPLGLNAVGGESAIRLSRLLTTSGILLTYGAMGRQPFRVSPGAMIFKELQYRGFWFSKLTARMSVAERQAMYEELSDLSNRGVVKIPVAEVFPLERIHEALQAAMRSGRSGKILLRLGEG